MSKRIIWAGSAIMLMALSGAVQAEVSQGQLNTDANIGAGIAQLLGEERSAMSGVSQRFDAVAPRPDVMRAGKSAVKMASASEIETPEIDYSRNWISAQPAAGGGEQFQCLADVLYFEARGESVAGQAAVAEVVLNRVESPKFPNSICDVVHQGGKSGCQFSWTCDGKTDRVSNQAAYSQVAKVARALMDGAPRQLTDGATYFHTPAVRPAWAKRFTRTTQIGSHIFYRPRVRTASN
ncbi:cell wall hydrolase [Albirhodobacter sp. R86504]|jgi:spore germination cell wall hydrolase CwlJ-like protein|uniref:cell wall hydrolase n=1 Tax=Albirhodobacter sp. R86504 TaxID=3093848 RepID=UPI0036725784